MSQRMQQGMPMIVLDEETERVSDRDAQTYNISAARAVAESVRSTLGPKGMDKMLVSSFGDITITNDGVTILDEMDIDNPTAEMVVEVAETQEEEAGDGTTTAVATAGELLKNAEDLIEQDIHPTAIIRGFALAAEQARQEVDDIATTVEADDIELLRKVAETSMTGKGTDFDKEQLAKLVVDAVEQVSVENADGDVVTDLEFIKTETQTGRAVNESTLLDGVVIDKDPVSDDMPRSFEDANVVLLDTSIEVEETEVSAEIDLQSPDQLQAFRDSEEEQIREQIEKLREYDVDVVLCQKNIDDLAQHYMAKAGMLGVRRVRKSDVQFLTEVLDVPLLTDIDSITDDHVARGSVTRSDDDELFYVEGEGAHGVTILLRGSTEHVVDELERGIEDALDVVSQAVTDGRVLPGGGAIETELAGRLRDYADSVEGREQLAVEAYADAVELVPRVLAENAGLDPIDTLVDLRAEHEQGHQNAGLDVTTGNVVDSFDAGVVEPALAKEQALSSAAEAANLVLKIDDIIAAGDLSTEPEEDPAEGTGDANIPGASPGMGGMGGM